LCISSFTTEGIVGGYGRFWNKDWIGDWRSWSFYHALALAYEYRAHLAEDPAPCDSLEAIVYAVNEHPIHLNRRCRFRFFMHRFIWSVFRQEKPDMDAQAHFQEGGQERRLRQLRAGLAKWRRRGRMPFRGQG